MSIKYIESVTDGVPKAVPIAGLNGLSGELIPSVSKYQSGSVTIPSTTISSRGFTRFQVTLSDAMPDTDYCVVIKSTGTIGITGKVAVDGASFTKTGFYLSVTNSSTEEITVSGSVTWQAFKLMTDAALLADEAQIQQNAEDITELKEAVSPIGTIKSTVNTVTMAAGAGNIVASLNLNAGTWLVTITSDIRSSINAVFSCGIGVNGTTMSVGSVYGNAQNGGGISQTLPVELTADGTVNAVAYGFDTLVGKQQRAYINAVRIK